MNRNDVFAVALRRAVNLAFRWRAESHLIGLIAITVKSVQKKETLAPEPQRAAARTITAREGRG